MLKTLLGIDADGSMDVTGLTLRSTWPAALLAVGVALAILYSIALYRRERLIGPVERISLTVLRAAALVVLVVVLFQPALRVETASTVPGGVLVLVDQSASMDIRDTRKDPVELAEVGMALGEVPVDDPNRMRAMARSVVALDNAARSMAGMDLSASREDLSAARQTLQGVQGRATRDDAPPSLAQLPSRLGPILRGIDEALAAVATARQADVTASADRVDKLSSELSAIERDVHAASLTVPEEVKPRLALIRRERIARGVLETMHPTVFGPLERTHRVRYFAFGERVRALGRESLDAAEQIAVEEPLASATDLGGALRAVTGQYGDRAISAVVALTDGASNEGSDPLEVADELGLRGVPVFPVGVGLANPDDVSVRSVVVQDVVFSGDIVPVRVGVHSSGFEKRTTMLSIRLDGVNVAQKTIVLTGKPQFEELTFTVSRAGGSKRLEVSVSPLADEASVENNAMSRTIRVVDEKVRVLCIEGSPRWEYRYLRAILKRDPRMEVTFLTTEGDPELARASDEHIARFPERLADAYTYDLIVLGDVRATHFTPGQLQTMEALVADHGGAMIVVAGHKHMPAEYLNTPIGEMLPVWCEQGSWSEVSEDVYLELTDAGQESTFMTLADGEAQNRSVWAKVNGLRRVAPVTGAKDGATVLATLSDAIGAAERHPLIAWQRYGSGKVLFVGTDRLWRLRDKVGDLYHTRFWSQAVQFLSLSRLLGESKRIRLEIGPGRPEVGRPVEVFAAALDETYEPLGAPTLPVSVQRVGSDVEGRSVALKAVPNLPGLYHGLIVPRRTGQYRITAAGDQAAQANVVDFAVTDTPPEQRQAAMQRDMLSKLAARSGGTYLPIHRLGVLPELLEGRSFTQRSVREVPLWDSWLVPLLLLVLVGVEWAWRRNKDLA